MLDITTIVLTYNEELHIRRCLENVCSFSKKVYVVDSPSTDNTVEICKEFPNVEVVVHPYPGNQAAQFNWALDHLSIDTEWVLRLDADEYLLPELVAEIRRKLPVMPGDVKGLEMRRRHIFMGRWVKHGVYPVVLMRMFRTGCARYEERLMDEHLVLNEGHTLLLDHDFCDHSLVDLSAYCTKHLLYARREAAELLADAYGLERTSGMRKVRILWDARPWKNVGKSIPTAACPCFGVALPIFATAISLRVVSWTVRRVSSLLSYRAGGTGR